MQRGGQTNWPHCQTSIFSVEILEESIVDVRVGVCTISFVRERRSAPSATCKVSPISIEDLSKPRKIKNNVQKVELSMSCMDISDNISSLYDFSTPYNCILLPQIRFKCSQTLAVGLTSTASEADPKQPCQHEDAEPQKNTVPEKHFSG